MQKMLLSVRDLSPEIRSRIFDKAKSGKELFHANRDQLKDIILANIFFQPSTRTQLSFQATIQRLGGKFIGFSNLEESRAGSSSRETLSDTVRVVNQIADGLVYRSTDPNDRAILQKYAEIPCISAGIGQDEHPTQAITDLFTLQALLGREKDFSILFVGNLAYRTVNSLVILLSDLNASIRIVAICPPLLGFNEYMKQFPDVTSMIKLYNSFGEFIESENPKNIDALYIEELRTLSISNDDANLLFNEFIISPHQLKLFSENVLILHPLPRSGVLSTDFDLHPGAAYFQQVRYGQFVRGALLLEFFN